MKQRWISSAIYMIAALNSASFVKAYIGSFSSFSRSCATRTWLTPFIQSRMISTHDNPNEEEIIDRDYPGTAVQRMRAARKRINFLAKEGKFTMGSSWETIRQHLLWAGGLRHLPQQGQVGYTGHGFQDATHVDLTCVRLAVHDHRHDGQAIPGIAPGNALGQSMQVASLPDLGPGLSWTTCQNGCHTLPEPRDVAHVQFQARIAFKLVWVPSAFTSFVLVDDSGYLLAQGEIPDDSKFPHISQRQMNYRLVQGSKYAKEADRIAASEAST